MDAALLLLGIVVVLFDAYAYNKYVGSRDRLESAYSSRRRALGVKRQFEADQAPVAKAPQVLPHDVPPEAHAAEYRPAAEVVLVSESNPGAAETEWLSQNPETFTGYAASSDAEIRALKSELSEIQAKITSLESAFVSGPAGASDAAEKDLEAKEAELKKMFMKREIDLDTYRAVHNEIAKARLGL